MNKMKRFEALLKGHKPRYIRVYDSGPDGSADRYTVVYTGRKGGDYVGMSADPFHPQGICQHGEGLIDRKRFDGGFLRPPTLGRKNHLGTRIDFFDLPDDCRRVVIREYAASWGLAEQDVAGYCTVGESMCHDATKEPTHADPREEI
jgi:hypothetical protein